MQFLKYYAVLCVLLNLWDANTHRRIHKFHCETQYPLIYLLIPQILTNQQLKTRLTTGHNGYINKYNTVHALKTPQLT